MGIRPFNPLKRINDLQERMVREGIDTLFLNYSRSVFYYTGTTQPSILAHDPKGLPSHRHQWY